MAAKPSKILDRVRRCIRLKGYSIRTERAYVSGIKGYILFHNKGHPQEMGKAEIERFLSHPAIKLNVSKSTQNQAFNALLFLYREVLERDLPAGISAYRAKKPVRSPLDS
ncbi:MAG: phage integrase N-terminal SAM-like domain-containing protein [Deltaproteobacteria bacterium]|nr:MAG: phage integrase N-terminal SAM-like domain-containing protein [Deltaproteobacteria bacterium]